MNLVDAQVVANAGPDYHSCPDDQNVDFISLGGSPTAQDRILATRMGVAAVDALLDDQRNVMMGIQNDEIVYVPFSKAIKNDKPINRDLLNTLRISSI